MRWSMRACWAQERGRCLLTGRRQSGVAPVHCAVQGSLVVPLLSCGCCMLSRVMLPTSAGGLHTALVTSRIEGLCLYPAACLPCLFEGRSFQSSASFLPSACVPLTSPIILSHSSHINRHTQHVRMVPAGCCSVGRCWGRCRWFASWNLTFTSTATPKPCQICSAL